MDYPVMNLKEKVKGKTFKREILGSRKVNGRRCGLVVCVRFILRDTFFGLTLLAHPERPMFLDPGHSPSVSPLLCS